jgi:beta-ureidopropionase
MSTTPSPAASPLSTSGPRGTLARVATVCQNGRFFRTVEENRAWVFELLEQALEASPDIVCLPETFATVGMRESPEVVETVPGPTTEAAAAYARRHRCYIVCPLRTKRDGRVYNSAVVLDRDGVVCGIYDKMHPVTVRADYTDFENGVLPGHVEGPPVFDLDFGRVAVQVCFDIGFPETWAALAAKGPRLVFWPSAYNGGYPLQTYAALHRLYVVSSVRTERSVIIDPCGTVLAVTDPRMNVIVRDINLDFAVCHYDFNFGIPDRIQAAYPGRVIIRSHADAGLFLVEPTDPTLTVAQLQEEFGFETTEQYHARHREAYLATYWGEAPPVQSARHGDRPMYRK